MAEMTSTTNTQRPGRGTAAKSPAPAAFLYEFRVRRIRRSSAKCARLPYGPLVGPADVASVLRHLTDEAPREEFYALYLDIRNQVVGFEQIASGTLTGVDVHPREVFRGALLASAAAIVVGHNHPSGDVTASSEDVALTERLRDAGELLGIPVLDHVIVAPDTAAHFSVAEARGIHAEAKFR